MRYGTRPRGLKERLAVLMGVVPYPMLDVLVAPVQTRALVAAARTGVFEALAEAPSTSGELSARLSLDSSTLDLVLRLLRSMGYLTRSRGRFSLSAMGRRHFGPKAPRPFSAFAAFGGPQWEWISRLEDTLREGRGVDIHRTLAGPEWDLYQRAMAEGAGDFAEFVARSVRLPRTARLCLDVAGSHGLVGAAVCRTHPGLRSVVIEKAEAIPEARRLAEAHGITDIVSFREGDLRSGPPYGQDADVVILANILHHFGRDESIGILERARAALRPGGTLAVFDIEAPSDDQAPEAAGEAAALFFRITSEGGCVPGRELAQWMKAAGLRAPRVKRSVRLPSRMLVTALAPA